MTAKQAASWSAAITIAVAAFVIGRTLGVQETFASGSTEAAAPQVQADIDALDDGAVTAEEYRAAFERDIACRVESGARVTGPITTDRFGQLGVTMERPGASNADAREALEAARDCHRRYLDAIQLAWARAHAPTPADLAEARRSTARCLIAAGIDIAESPGPNEIHDRFLGPTVADGAEPLAAVMACLQATSEELNWPGYWGN